MDKSKFVVNPHLDSEGFVKYGPPHYLGELTDNQREDQRINALLANAHVDGLTLEERNFVAAHENLHETLAWALANPQLRYEGAITGRWTAPNPTGWQEADSVPLPPINWAERSDEEVEAAFQLWLGAR